MLPPPMPTTLEIAPITRPTSPFPDRPGSGFSPRGSEPASSGAEPVSDNRARNGARKQTGGQLPGQWPIDRAVAVMGEYRAERRHQHGGERCCNSHVYGVCGSRRIPAEQEGERRHQDEAPADAQVAGRESGQQADQGIVNPDHGDLVTGTPGRLNRLAGLTGIA
jgi:hypothetical protein